MIKTLIEISKYAGMREDLVQAGGGNSSFKLDKNRMAIKASGYQLADITEEHGYAIVDPQVIANAFLQNEDLNQMTEEDSKQILSESFIEGERPSIETFLHAISGTYTLHTHPIVVNVFTSRTGGMERLKELFPEALFVPYATPGVELAKAYFKAYSETQKDASIVFLENHGLVVSADSAGEVIQQTEMIVSKLEEELGVEFTNYHQVTDLYHFLGDDGIVWNVTDANVRNAYEAFGTVWNHMFCPDCVVFLGKKMFEVKNELDENELGCFIEKNGIPTIIAYKSELYIHAQSVKKALEIQSVLSFSAQVMLQNKDLECNLLSEKEQNFLLNWDAEKYRKTMK